MQELNQVFRPKRDSQSETQQPERELTATEILERDWMGCPGDIGMAESYRQDGWTDEEILPFLRSFA